MLSLLLASACLVPNRADVMPAAMVLEVKGGATVKTAKGLDRKITTMLVLGTGDRVTVADGGQVTLVFLKDGQQERLSNRTEATIGPDGCKASRGVEQVAAPTPSRAVRDGLQNLKENERGATRIFRSDTAPSGGRPRVTPISESKVLSDRPQLTWAPVSGAKGYLVQVVVGGSNRAIWSKAARTTETTLSYPEGEKPLPRGRKYRWTVLAEVGDELRKVAESEFSVAGEAEVKALAELKTQAEKGKTSDLLLIALAYHNAGLFDEALALFEGLSKVAPEEAAFHAAKAEYYEQGGRVDEAKASWQRARELGYVPPGEKEPRP